MNRTLRSTLVLLFLAMCLLVGLTTAQPAAAQSPTGTPGAQTAVKYHFVMVSHIGSSDPNMLWLTFAIKDFMKRYPDVDVKYVATDQFSVENMTTLLKQTIATKPDGIAIPIVSAAALGPVLNDAIKAGIPVVAVNTIPDGAKTIPYLTYVGGDDHQTGIMLAQAVLDAAKAGTVNPIKGAVCANPDMGHAGLLARCKGWNDTMAAANIKSETFDISTDPAKEGSNMQSYLNSHKDVNAIFSTTARTGPIIYSAAKDLGLTPGVDTKANVVMVSTDESPVSLEGIKQGKILATHSQGFYLQGFTPFEILYWNLQFGYRPSTDLLSGPILITKSNIDSWIPLTRNALGNQYDTLSQGAWQ